MRATLRQLQAACVAATAVVGAQGFSSPDASLPDVLISESLVTKSEGQAFTYTVQLTHPPGMREDGTIDLLNDEVRIYLTSSQEVLQQDDVGGVVEWQQRRNHRTQLRIYTNDITGSGNAGSVSGPLPYVYVAYSTVNPSHASPVSSGQYSVVCPLPTHPAYAELTDVVITDTAIPASGGDEAFDGCYQIQYNGFAPVLDACAETPTDLVTSCDDRHRGTATCTETADVSDSTDAAACAAVIGLDLLTSTACEDVKLDADGTTPACTYTGGSPDSGSHYARTGSTYPEPAHAVFTSAAKADCVVNLPVLCTAPVSGFDGVTGLLTAKEAGGGGVDGGGSDNSESGDSDYRIYSDGSAVARDVVDGASKCRYCGAPGLFCDTAGNDGPGTGCPVVTVNGGDQQPEEPNWLYPTYISGPSWRGDLSSSAQLIFDSTNWNVPQTVQVTVRDDDVFEPEVHKRGQDALVHHYVVAQDINLQHTYYEDIDVNDLVVSITDDDPAILIESAKLVTCTENPLDDCSIAYRLASEPLYDVTVYLQSGDYFDPSVPVPTVGTALPDDEQVIFQDMAQYETCYDADTGHLIEDCTDAQARQGCAINGRYVTLVSARVNKLPDALPTGPLRESFECARLASEDACLSHAGSGCVWNGPDCEPLSQKPYTAKDITCSTFTGDGQETCEAYDSCDWNEDDAECFNVKYGYDCRSYMFFTTTNWDTFQTMKVIGIPDFVDEVMTESAVGVLMESRDWYYNSVASRLMEQTKTDFRPTVDGVLWGEQYLSETACEARDNTAAAAGDELEPITCTWDGESCTCTVERGMFDTRKGVHNPRYVRLSSDSDLYAVDPAIDGSTPALSYIQSNWGPSFAKASPRLSSGTYQGAYHEIDADNIAACCQDADTGNVRTIDDGSPDIWPDEPRVYDPDDLTQVVAFAPSEYANNGVYEGATVRILESPLSPGRGVTISRTNCEATEGRRYWFDQFVAHPTPVGTLGTTYGLFTGEGSIANTAASDGDASLPAGGSGDGWTMVDVPAAASGYADMTAPVCPYTIVLDSAPTEGRTAVISLREDVELSTLRDHELYFYEEPSYRSDESGSEVTEAECAGIGGSDWVNGGCFINNVPCFASDTTDWSHSNRRLNAAGDVSCEEGDVILARGSTDLDVMFTEADWNIPRRITAIALNDDVDEPTEIRTIYHSVTPCSGYNHNTMVPCMEDSTYTNEVPAASVDVRVVDNDIADLVVICGDGYTSGAAAETIDEFFIGSYDMSGPSSDNIWYENFERAGPNAEDGISGSEFGGSITPVGGATDTVVTYPGQAVDDGIGGGGHNGDAGANTDGYLTDRDDPMCANFLGNPALVSSDPSPKCFNPSDVSWTHYDPFYDRYTTGGTRYSEFSRDTYGGVSVDISTHNRGFKGIGPATTEPEDEYACTIHSRECLNDVFGDDTEDGVDSTNTAPCRYGTFQVRLNSSPGTKHVRRQYVGEVETTVDEELVYVVVSPDVTHQTVFDPPSVTFTHTGGTLADGQDTYRWDEPVTIKVVPVDDAVDERAGVIIDYTSFTITQSNFGEDYWEYTVPYQTGASTGTLKVANDGSTGRVDDHTPFRHHIRTIHTADNDFAGVRLESRTVSQVVSANPNVYSHDPVALSVTEGGTFAFYSIRLDTQPHKPQRQAGTNPNTEITNSNCDITPDIVSAGTNVVGAYTVPGYDDYSSYTRPNACGSIEHEEDYWVDVTVTQTIHVDLGVPESCPDTAAWGGGSSPDHEYLHPRFPYNAKNDGTGYYRPINELTHTADDMDGYLTTCGGWQHDATYRFTASNWNVPQYVYLYAHNDRDASSTTGHVDLGGNEGSSPIDTTLIHYVETEDTPYNMRRAGYVQRNKHGGVYTQGNLERFPFGVIDDKHNRVTGRTTYGFSTYHTLHEFVNPTTVPVPTVDCIGTECMGEGSGDLCCLTTMGMVPVRGSINYEVRGSLGLAGYQTAVLHSNTCTGTQSTDSDNDGSDDCSAIAAFVSSEDEADCPALDDCIFTAACPGYALASDAADVCTEGVTGTNMNQPWKDDGTPCRPLYSTGNLCVPKYATTNTCTGTDSNGDDCSAIAAFVASQDEANCPVSDGCVFTAKGGMRFPPNSVVVTVTDNDSAEDDSVASAAASAGNCRQTSLLQYTDSTFKINRKEWLTDWNCDSGDAGGLPGYPVANTDGAA